MVNLELTEPHNPRAPYSHTNIALIDGFHRNSDSRWPIRSTRTSPIQSMMLHLALASLSSPPLCGHLDGNAYTNTLCFQIDFDIDSIWNWNDPSGWWCDPWTVRNVHRRTCIAWNMWNIVREMDWMFSPWFYRRISNLMPENVRSGGYLIRKSMSSVHVRTAKPTSMALYTISSERGDRTAVFSISKLRAFCMTL